MEHLDTDATGNKVDPPLNTFSPKSPASATVMGVGKVISDDAPGDIMHVILRLPEELKYVEGQSLSVIPPGADANGKPHKVRAWRALTNTFFTTGAT